MRVNMAQEIILNIKLRICENEKNSIVTNIVLCKKTQAIEYFKNEKKPIEEMPGVKASYVSRGTNRRKNVGLMNARATVAAAFMPSVSEKISIVIPRKKAQSIIALRDTPDSNLRIR